MTLTAPAPPAVEEDEAAGGGGKKRWILVAITLVIVPILALAGYTVMVMIMIASSMGGSGNCSPNTGTLAGVDVQVSGQTMTLEAAQVRNAATIVSVAKERDVPATGQVIALMVALQESTLWVYANTSTYPESANIPHDRDGKDHDSLGVFQQRPSSGWGTVAETMDVKHSAESFFGGPEGPNHGSPRGLLDINGWESMELGVAAQTVQVSAFPDAYNKWESAAKTLVATVTGSVSCSGGGDLSGAALPLAPGFNIASGYGPRDIDIPGASSWHPAVDMQHWPGNCNDPVYAVLPGEVTLSSTLWLSIRNPDGFVVSYLHMYKSDRLVNVGDKVKAGQQIGVTGNVPPSGGCHLDLRIDVTENTNPKVAQLQRSETIGGPPGYVDPEAFMRLYGIELCPNDGSCRRFE